MDPMDQFMGKLSKGETVVCLRLSHNNLLVELESNPIPGLLTLILGFCLL